MSNIDYSTKIPNNVNLAGDRKVQRALEQWQPAFINWWDNHGPNWAANDDIFLRTATSANTDGWAVFDYVKMPDYRWGIFLADPIKDRKISFGEGVERVFPLHSTNIDEITVVRRGRVRRAKLYYLRERRGKSARIVENVNYKPLKA